MNRELSPEQSWLADMIADLRWLAGYSFCLSELGDPRLCFGSWKSFIMACDQWIFGSWISGMVSFPMPLMHLLMNSRNTSDRRLPMKQSLVLFVARSGSPSRHWVDMSTVHSFRSCVRACAFDSTCHCCLTNYRTRPKLIRHLSQKSPKCLTRTLCRASFL